jgi:hypothetical protein
MNVDHPIALVLAVISFVCFLVLSLYEMIFALHLRPYRIDLKPKESIGQGSSIFFQVNVMNPANYSEEGKVRLRKLYWIEGVRLAVLFVTMLFAFGAMG